MFGFLTADTSRLSEEGMERYRGYYCGLCRELQKRHGIKGMLTLNYDMTFLILLLGSVYESDEQSWSGACIAHPVKKHVFWSSGITEYAADMNVALAYLKLLDNWKDDCSIACYGGAAVLKREFLSIKKRYPLQVAAMERSVDELSVLEHRGCQSPDEVSDTFGLLMESILSPYDDYWNRYLKPFGRDLGRFIYLLDAVVDLEKDSGKGSYNVFSSRVGMEDNEDYFRSILKIYLGDAVSTMNMLPIDRDKDIIDNILCLGVWAEFNKIYSREGCSENVSGPI